MGYHDAEDYVIWATVVVAVSTWILSGRKPELRSAPLILAAHGVGIYIGIDLTARGSFEMPLGVMQRQLEKAWGVQLECVLHPEDEDCSGEAVGS